MRNTPINTTYFTSYQGTSAHPSWCRVMYEAKMGAARAARPARLSPAWNTVSKRWVSQACGHHVKGKVPTSKYTVILLQIVLFDHMTEYSMGLWLKKGSKFQPVSGEISGIIGQYSGVSQCPRRCLGRVGQDPRNSKPGRLRVGIFWFCFVHLRYMYGV